MLPQANLAAVPWNIAANAVMAGCRPEHMPVLIAAVEAIADNAYNLNNIGSTWGVLPFLLVNGPAAARLGIENGAQLVNKGANPAIGRALGLIIRNIAGYKLAPQLHGHVRLSDEFRGGRERGGVPVGAVPRRARLRQERQHGDGVRHGDVGLAAGDLRHGGEVRGAGRARIPEPRVHQEALPRQAGRARPERVPEHDHVPDRAAGCEGAGRRRIHASR